MVSTRSLVAGLAAAGALLLHSGLALAQAPEEDPFLVQIQGNLFLKPELVVPAGTTVTWLNLDPDLHDVIDLTFAFESPVFGAGETWQATLWTPGTYNYLCDLHANMTGIIHVVEQPASEAPASEASGPAEADSGYGAGDHHEL